MMTPPSTHPPTHLPASMCQIRSLVTSDGRLELSIATVAVTEPGEHDVVVRIEAAPINPTMLSWARESAGYSREDVADRLKVKVTTIAKCETGEGDVLR